MIEFDRSLIASVACRGWLDGLAKNLAATLSAEDAPILTVDFGARSVVACAA